MPQLHIDCQWSKNENDMMLDALEMGTSFMQKAGFSNIQSRLLNQPPGLAIHEVGTARMGKNPKDSVLNGFNQSHDVANLFVTDGSSFCSTGVGNPSLTFMAITARAVDYAVREVKAGRL